MTCMIQFWNEEDRYHTLNEENEKV